ncbi:hypothetical protein F8M41_010968 [Gigaspora margarita]|uniref:F-box domain-containing protein n=1 Tax=Gigaspora margarita TaxID=4874 RepID=A0A8H4AU25_GIGMA|nr:hypothetical protein F8M41_010968 [Gigaspora margarita]
MQLQKVGTLPNELANKILSLLPAENLCCAREVSRRWREMVNEPNLWKAKFLSTTQYDSVPLSYPSDPKQWEEVYCVHHFREHNWVLVEVMMRPEYEECYILPYVFPDITIHSKWGTCLAHGFG